MIENFNLLLLSGGFYRCSPSWDKDADSFDQCFKFYFPLSGQACVKTKDGEHLIEPGNVYFICGFDITGQFCREHMDVYWVHFVPQSLYFRHLLLKAKPFFQWPMRRITFAHDIYTKLGLLFANPDKEKNKPAPDRPMSLSCEVHSLLLYLLGDLLKQANFSVSIEQNKIFTKLKPAIDFMNDNYTRNPSLAEIARQTHLVPNYFHRLFKQAFGITAFDYMLKRRMNRARQLLGVTNFPIKKIAAMTGYENEFYFSRMFKQHFNLSPSQLRKNQWIA